MGRSESSNRDTSRSRRLTSNKLMLTLPHHSSRAAFEPIYQVDSIRPWFRFSFTPIFPGDPCKIIQIEWLTTRTSLERGP